MTAAHPDATASASSASQSSSSGPDAGYRTVWVAPPVGSLLGGGFVPVADNAHTSGEAALLGTIKTFNATGEFRSSGASQRALQFQQDQLQLRFGELCTINTIARDSHGKNHGIATFQSRNRAETELAKNNSVSTPDAVQTPGDANQTTENSNSNNGLRPTGAQDRLKSLRARPRVAPGG
jgi:hypothetical protein